MRRLLAILFLCAAPAFPLGEWGLGDYGYEGRANGMDWDDDFVYGEAVDDGKACDDADTDGAVIVIEDIDGDSDDEAQIYVIPATGTDDGDCGGPNAADACETVQYALDNRMDTGSYEDIICLVGTAHESITVDTLDGDAGTKTRTASGDEVYDFQYPSNPNVIMGADRDQDGEYPPYDTDDTAVFDGEVGDSYFELFLNTGDGATGDADRWEYAHFTVQEYGTYDGQTFTDPVNGITLSENGASADTIVRIDGGSFVTDGWVDFRVRVLDSVANDDDYIIDTVSASTLTLQIDDFSADDIANTSIRIMELRDAGTVRGMFETLGLSPGYSEDHIYYHDIYGYKIGYLGEELSFANMLYEWWGRRATYNAIENVAVIDSCGYLMRGQAKEETERIRLRNTTTTFWCEDNPEERVDHSPGMSGVKLWGEVEYMEFLNNDYDGDASRFVSSLDEASEMGCGAYVLQGCVRDTYVVNNIVRNCQNSFLTQGGSEASCTTRNGGDLHFLRNYVVADVSSTEGFPRWIEGVNLSLGGPNVLHTNLTIANNYFLDLTGEGWLTRMFFVGNSVDELGPDPSAYTVAFVNNTGYSPNWGESTSATEKAIIMFDDDATDQPHNYVIKNNVIAGGGADDVPVRWISSGVGCSDVDMDYNVYETAGGDRNWWGCDNQRYTSLDLYSAATGLDTHSKGEGQNFCEVTFLNRGSDMHLLSSDTCAQEAGISVSSYTTVDFDGDSRPQSTSWDIGADEYASGYTPKGARDVSPVSTPSE